MQPCYDSTSGQWWCSKTLYCQFAVMSSIIAIEFSLTIPHVGRRRFRGQVNLFELLPYSKPTTSVSMKVPALTMNNYGVDSSPDTFYLTLCLSMVKD